MGREERRGEVRREEGGGGMAWAQSLGRHHARAWQRPTPCVRGVRWNKEEGRKARREDVRNQAVATQAWNLAVLTSVMAVATWKAVEHYGNQVVERKKNKVVVVGSGFAGVRVARRMQADVTMLAKRDYFEFTPGVAHAMVDGTHKQLTMKLEKAVPNARVEIIGNNDVVDVEDGYVHVHGKTFAYDYLVLATGSTYTPPLKPSKIEERMHVRERAFRICAEALKDASNVLVIGGGVAGVELAASFVSRYPQKKVYLADEHDRLLYKLPREASVYAEKRLRDKGVRLVLGERIKSRGMNGRTKGFECTTSGNTIEVEAVFFCSGKKPNSEFGKVGPGEPLLEWNEKGYIRVNECLQSTRSGRIFVLGDVREKQEREYIAGQAEREADYVVKCIHRLLDGKEELPPFRPGAVRLSVALGPSDGLMVNGDRLVAKGMVVPLVKQVIERWTIWFLAKRYFDFHRRMAAHLAPALV